MKDIRVVCRTCDTVALYRPAEVLLLTSPDQASGVYLVLCPLCHRITANTALARAVHMLVAAGVPAGSADGRATGIRPGAPADFGPLFTLDDLLDFHLLLAGDDWFSRLARSVRPPLPG